MRIRQSGRNFTHVLKLFAFSSVLVGCVKTPPVVSTNSANPVRCEADERPIQFNSTLVELQALQTDSKVDGEFVLTNSSSSVVSFHAIEASCSCVVTDFAGTILGAGEEITLPFQVSKPRGETTHSIIVRYECGGMDYVKRLRVKVQTPMPAGFIANPRKLDLGAVHAGDHVEGTIEFVQRRKDVEAVPALISAPEWLSCNIAKNSTGQWELNIAGKAPGEIGSLAYASIVVQGAESCLSIPLEGNVIGDHVAKPERLVWIASREKHLGSKEIEIVSSRQIDSIELIATGEPELSCKQSGNASLDFAVTDFQASTVKGYVDVRVFSDGSRIHEILRIPYLVIRKLE